MSELKSKEAVEYAAKLFPCEKPCDSFGVCDGCCEAKCFWAGYNFGNKAALSEKDRAIETEYIRGFNDGKSYRKPFLDKIAELEAKLAQARKAAYHSDCACEDCNSFMNENLDADGCLKSPAKAEGGDGNETL